MAKPKPKSISKRQLDGAFDRMSRRIKAQVGESEKMRAARFQVDPEQLFDMIATLLGLYFAWKATRPPKSGADNPNKRSRNKAAAKAIKTKKRFDKKR